jgi:CheY-like chemotaxis protein
MIKTENSPGSPQQKPAPEPVRHRRPKTNQRPKINLALDQAELSDMIDRIREEVDSHFRCATEIKAKMEKLTGAAVAELLKVKELKNIVESLKNNGRQEAMAAQPQTGPARPPTVSPPEGSVERWRLELDRDLEKLLIIKRLLEASVPPPAKNSDPPVLPAASGVKRILVVDDDPTTVKIVEHFLQKENYLVSSSPSGVDGLKKALKEDPALILLDIMMPDLNGFQFLSAFRMDAAKANVPVVILSSLAEEADVLKGLSVGAVDYITKPFSPQVLLAKIRKNINSGP